MKIVQELLGHANVGITLGTYGHVLPGMHTEATPRMDSLLTGPIDSPKGVKTG